MSSTLPIEKLRNAIQERGQKVKKEIERMASHGRRDEDELVWFVDHSFNEINSIKQALEEQRSRQNLEIDDLQALSSEVLDMINALRKGHE